MTASPPTAESDGVVTFMYPETARQFCRLIAPKGAMAGSGNWSSDRIVILAGRWARQLGPQKTAEIIASFKGKGVSFSGVKCSVCGTALSAPESVAAGVGPECQRAGAA